MLDAVQDSIFKVKINLVSSSPALQQEGIESLREILAIGNLSDLCRDNLLIFNGPSGVDNPLIPTLVIDLGIFPPLINILTETNDSVSTNPGPPCHAS